MSKEITLLPHNEEAYVKLNNCLDNNQIATINHATGTGKSFILLKYLFENRNKRILYLAPTYQILEQLVEEHALDLGIDMNDFSLFDTMIYRSLLDLDMEELASKYDIIVFDEYHRLGARKWGKKAQELKDIIKSKYPDKKIIGTTATEIRYLDNNKNMKDLLFDGVEASRLTLSDAILRGILPVPIYYVFNYNLINEVNLLERRVGRYCPYPDIKEGYLRELLSIKNKIEYMLKTDDDLKKYLKIGKHLVFSSKIDNLNQDRYEILKFLGDFNIPVYKVHSRQAKEVNKKELYNFRRSKEGILFSINLLNEGVHVKDVDSIFMLRQTISPIIYFQQLGRLLSYSRRKDDVVVFDLVNNLKRNPVIYKLYRDLYMRAKELIVSDPINRDRYESIVNKFRVIDKTSDLCERVDELKLKINKSSLIDERLHRAVDILEDSNSNYAELFQAKNDIFRFYKYITVPLFDRISLLSLDEKPFIFNFDHDSFVKLLDGSSNLTEVYRDSFNKIYLGVKLYIEENGIVPSIYSEDGKEKILANFLIQNFERFNSDKKNFIKEYLQDDLSLIERIVYDVNNDDINYNDLIDDIRELMIDKIKIPDCIIDLLRERLIMSSDKMVEVSDEDRKKYKIGSKMVRAIELAFVDKEYSKLTKSEYQNIVLYNSKIDIKEDDLIPPLEQKQEQISQALFSEKFESVTSSCMEELKHRNIEEVVDELYHDLYEFINKFQKMPNFNSKNELELKLFCKKIIFKDQLDSMGYTSELDEQLINIKLERRLGLDFDLADRIIKFMKDNNGDLPYDRSPDEEESSLAKSYRYRKRKLNPTVIETLKKEMDKYPGRKSEVLQEYTDFVSKYKREPLISESEYERELVLSYNRWLPYLSKEERTQIYKVSGVSKSRMLQNAYMQMLEKRRSK